MLPPVKKIECIMDVCSCVKFSGYSEEERTDSGLKFSWSLERSREEQTDGRTE